MEISKKRFYTTIAASTAVGLLLGLAGSRYFSSCDCETDAELVAAQENRMVVDAPSSSAPEGLTLIGTGLFLDPCDYYDNGGLDTQNYFIYVPEEPAAADVVAEVEQEAPADPSVPGEDEPDTAMTAMNKEDEVQVQTEIQDDESDDGEGEADAAAEDEPCEDDDVVAVVGDGSGDEQVTVEEEPAAEEQVEQEPVVAPVVEEEEQIVEEEPVVAEEQPEEQPVVEEVEETVVEEEPAAEEEVVVEQETIVEEEPAAEEEQVELVPAPAPAEEEPVVAETEAETDDGVSVAVTVGYEFETITPPVTEYDPVNGGSLDAEQIYVNKKPVVAIGGTFEIDPDTTLSALAEIRQFNKDGDTDFFYDPQYAAGDLLLQLDHRVDEDESFNIVFGRDVENLAPLSMANPARSGPALIMPDEAVYFNTGFYDVLKLGGSYTHETENNGDFTVHGAFMVDGTGLGETVSSILPGSVEFDHGFEVGAAWNKSYEGHDWLDNVYAGATYRQASYGGSVTVFQGNKDVVTGQQEVVVGQEEVTIEEAYSYEEEVTIEEAYSYEEEYVVTPEQEVLLHSAGDPMLDAAGNQQFGQFGEPLFYDNDVYDIIPAVTDTRTVDVPAVTETQTVDVPAVTEMRDVTETRDVYSSVPQFGDADTDTERQVSLYLGADGHLGDEFKWRAQGELHQIDNRFGLSELDGTVAAANARLSWKPTGYETQDDSLAGMFEYYVDAGVSYDSVLGSQENMASLYGADKTQAGQNMDFHDHRTRAAVVAGVNVDLTNVARDFVESATGQDTGDNFFMNANVGVGQQYDFQSNKSETISSAGIQMGWRF